MQRITYIGQTKPYTDQSGIWSLERHLMLQQAGNWGYIPNIDLAPTVYTRPIDWLELPIILNSDQKFAGLYAIFDHDSNFVKLTATGNYVVDWGDGSSVEYYSSNSEASHVYNFNDLDNSTLTSEGYKQAIITVTPDLGYNLSTLSINESISEYGPSSSVGWLDICIASPHLMTLNIGQTGSVSMRYLQQVRVLSNIISNWFRMFSNCSGLKSVVSLYTTSGTNFGSMFEGCNSLISVPSFDTVNGTNFSNMFGGCSSLVNMPIYDTSRGTNFSNMYSGCVSLQEIPFSDTSLGTNFSGMFSGCKSLKTIPPFDTSNGTSFEYTFAACNALTTVPLLNTSNALSCVRMFENCYSLESLPRLNLNKCTNMSGMFASCVSLNTIPELNTGNVTTFLETFNNCTSLIVLPPLNTRNVTSFSYTFNNCQSLKTIPELDVSNGTTFFQMFGYCVTLTKVPPMNTSNGTNFSNMFVSCPALAEFPQLDVSNGTNFSLMFGGCISLQYIDGFNSSIGTNFENTFLDCYGLVSVSNVDTGNGENFTNTFKNTFNLRSIGNIDLTNGTTFSGMFAKEFIPNTSSLASFDGSGMKYSMNFDYGMLSRQALETIFNNAGTANLAAQSFTITGNYGADVPINRTGTTTTGSSVISIDDTSSLAVGMLVTGNGISDPAAVTLLDADSSVNRTGHGLSDNTTVSFDTIVTTSGISTFRIYYVVNSAPNSFQISSTRGGSNIALIGDGSGTILYPSYIDSVSSNVSITLSAPATDDGTVTITSRYLDTSSATLKGWTIIE